MDQARKNTVCKGKHPVDGKYGCGNNDCRGLDLCVETCLTCPNYRGVVANTVCKGQHPVTGGCSNELCRGLTLCRQDCYTCPDYVASKAAPTLLYGEERCSRAVKVFMACMAGPADPTKRNDITWMNNFTDLHNVPQENKWMLLVRNSLSPAPPPSSSKISSDDPFTPRHTPTEKQEKQCTPKSILATLSDCIDTVVEPGDLLIVYLGGHGTATGGQDYGLFSYVANTRGPDLAPIICSSKCEVFLIVDSCYSGAIITDLQNYLEQNPDAERPDLRVLTSVQKDLSAQTGWRLLQMLIDYQGPSSKISIPELCTTITSTLRTPNEQQRAQYFSFLEEE